MVTTENKSYEVNQEIEQVDAKEKGTPRKRLPSKNRINLLRKHTRHSQNTLLVH